MSGKFVVNTQTGICHYNGKQILLCDILEDLAGHMPKNEIAAKHGFEKKHFSIILAEAAKIVKTVTFGKRRLKIKERNPDEESPSQRGLRRA